ncbi:long-chain-fatty-acid-CoA ligase [Acetivibrio straminisolvens JCM 21531]|uniref:Long-chain-fatty-acid-CoA ligase n=1 Tax=Acetivibrio straminisolvens JCM 21531 TaxID=1294263 RepID=W4V5R6_9FIRM|nr:long-chain-fatty-acid-CoA ligase [Acetivibrio straminisolvens JCM 21531]
MPIEIQSDVTTFLHFNFPLCTLLWNKNIYPWMNEHFIQLYTMMHNTGVCWVDMLEKDYFYEDVSDIIDMSSEHMKDVSDIVKFVIDNINNNYYSTIYTNEYYLPGRAAYHKYTHIHQTLLYGYDLDKEVFFGLGYDGRQRFVEAEYPFEIFREAYEKGKAEYDNDFCWVKMHTAYLNRVFDLKEPYQARIEIFLKKLNEYIYAIPDESLLRKDVVIEMGKNAKYGMQVYESILDNLKKLLKGEFKHDYRTFHLLAEHKRGMLKKIEYFMSKNGLEQNIGIYLKEYQNIVKGFENARLIYLRAELVDNNYETIIGQLKNKEAIQKVYDIVNFNSDKEYQILCNIYKCFASI